MAQGTRGRFVRTAAIGLGMVIGTGLVGCTGWDKPKETKATKAPGQGLPGTPTLPPSGGTAGAKWQPGTGSQFTGPGSMQQPNFATAGTAGGFQPGRTGINTNTGTAGGSQNWGQQNWNQPQPGHPGTVNSPVVPGVVPPVTPAGGVGAAPHLNNGGIAQAGYTPPAPNLDSIPLPPAAPGTDFGSGAGVLPPVAPGPLSPPAAPPGAGPGRGGF